MLAMGIGFRRVWSLPSWNLRRFGAVCPAPRRKLGKLGAVTRVTAAGSGVGYWSLVAGETPAGGIPMIRITNMARSTWDRAQATVVFALCVGASLVLPLTLASIGIHAL